MTNFKQWMIETYSHNEMADMANHGCSGGVGGMIYYTETAALYRRFADDLHELLSEYHGDTGTLPKTITEDLTEGATQFQNSMVWFGAEYVAYQLTQGEYKKETEETEETEGK
jgi:ubiquinone biosynthesis protein UbiJ